MRAACYRRRMVSARRCRAEPGSRSRQVGTRKRRYNRRMQECRDGAYTDNRSVMRWRERGNTATARWREPCRTRNMSRWRIMVEASSCNGNTYRRLVVHHHHRSYRPRKHPVSAYAMTRANASGTRATQPRMRKKTANATGGLPRS